MEFLFLALVSCVFGLVMWKRASKAKARIEALTEGYENLEASLEVAKDKIYELKAELSELKGPVPAPVFSTDSITLEKAMKLGGCACGGKKRPAAPSGQGGRVVATGVTTASSPIVVESGHSTSDMLLAGVAGYALGSMGHDSSPSHSSEPSFSTHGGEFSGGGATYDYSSHSSYNSGSSYDSGSSDCGGGDCGGGGGD